MQKAVRKLRIAHLVILAMLLQFIPGEWMAATYAASGPETFTTKSYDSIPNKPMTDVTYGNGTYVAVGYYGTIVRSTDADHWQAVKTSADSHYNGVTDPNQFMFYGASFGNGVFVVTGSKGVILTSPDGITWTQQASGVTSDISSVRYLTLNGNSAFYALTQGTYLTSPDGITWTQHNPAGFPGIYGLTTVTVGNGGTRLAFGGGDGKIYSTVNGTTWSASQPQNPDHMGSLSINMLSWMKDRYFISDAYGYIWMSTDLSSFTLAGSPFKQSLSQTDNQMFNGFYDGTFFYLFGNQSPYGYGAVYMSTTGTSWTMQPFKSEFVAQKSAYLNGKYIRVGNEGLQVSTDGSNWEYKWSGTFRDILYDGSQYVAVGAQGNDGTVWTSPDLSDWTLRTISPHVRSLKAAAYGNGAYVAVGDVYQSKPALLTSADGASWTIQSPFTQSESLGDVAFGNGTFVAVGSKYSGSANNPFLATSSDGVLWNKPTLPASNAEALFSVTYANNQFIVIGYGYDDATYEVDTVSLWTSPDGLVWTDRSAAYSNQTDTLANILYDGTKYIASGSDSSYQLFTRSSADLASWSAPSFVTGASLSYSSLQSLQQKNGVLYLLGTNSSNAPALYYSADEGNTWQEVPGNVANSEVGDLLEANGAILLAGSSKLVISSVAPVVQNSTVNPTGATFDKNTADPSAGHYADVAVTVTLKGNSLSGLELDGAAISSSAYSFDAQTGMLILKKEYLTGLAVGTHSFTLGMSGGVNPTLTVSIGDSTPAKSNDSTLSELRLSEGTLAPAFASGTTGYTASVGNAVTSLTVTPTVNEAHATVTVNGTPVASGSASGAITLSEGANTVTVVVTAEDGTTTQTYTITVTRDSAPPVASNDATLSGLTLSEGTLAPAFASGTTGYTASVGNAVTSLTVTPTVNEAHATVTVNGTPVASGSASGAITLSEGANTVTVVVTAEDGTTTQPYTITVTRETAPTGGSTTTPPADSGVEVYVNGKAESAGTATTTMVDNRRTVTIDVDPQKLDARLAAAGPNAVITVLFTRDADVLVGELNGDLVRKMERQNASLELKTSQASYRVPAPQIDIQKLASELGVNPEQVKLRIEISKTGITMQNLLEAAAQNKGFTLTAPSYDFRVSAFYGTNVVEITSYSAYVQRTIAIPAGVDPSRITTGVVVEADGTVRHVPTQVTQTDGNSYATINSLTNSTYSVIGNPVEFIDVASHWSKNAVNDMGSRMIVEGVGGGLFEPDRDITRAEFAAILVKGLGLRPQAYDTAPFTDVSADAWYSGAVQTAYSYGLITGYEDGSFRPTVKISRQEAMTIIAKAMKITGLTEKLSGTDAVLSAYQDRSAIASWAYSSIAACVESGVVSGRGAGKLAPASSITRAEVAVIVQRLLQKSNLI
ncbi:cadherin-like beta sandwich domain-containing protein [Gorillibacterium timonense]|uniref:cadherin-like beta sandwich domain-containing protein n=1 Tax=Gorillibacterium timonense TaxID=1689269 RepID=UPI00071DA9D0|nr:cadherin-like beta sandwich domain-containing protein [Gorillibacterium timonense]